MDLEEFYGEEEVVTACDQPEFVVEEGEISAAAGDGEWFEERPRTATTVQASPGKIASAEALAEAPQHLGDVGAEETAIGSDGEGLEPGDDEDDDDLSNLIMVANEDEYGDDDDDDDEEDAIDEEEEEQENIRAEHGEIEEDSDTMLTDRVVDVGRSHSSGRSGRRVSSEMDFGIPQQEVAAEEIVDFDSTEDVSATSLEIASNRQSSRAANAGLTAYMLFARETRDSVMQCEPHLDFSQLNKRLGALWNGLTTSKKYNYRRRALRLGQKAANAASGGGGARMKSTGRWAGNRSSSAIGADGLTIDPARAVATGPLDLAAHLLLLGESLETIGRRLCDRDGQIAVQGALSVVLDSLMCALVPLVALTQHVEPLAGACDRHQLQQALDNVAYFMPGL